ncbi:uncharacterized protein BDW47DRAFT_33359 [Aspergillus candidus]|uniref:Uncharacterized protein n=1 Tax=Aspergillus candidus TaxID=41067 RepID=A0A2I2FBH0_ASPCN|nr:hypothetical protein BDW47DRAFT_33359 [Aspergillus candidus]PLB37963.1 hypothetical protein BDW47DRAFT_33359 [Aspergillus candidus]
MVLLTSSTVSVILSTGIICTFTILLFLSGYILQQQSVRSIQHALRPPDPLSEHGSPRSPFKRSSPLLERGVVLPGTPSDQQDEYQQDNTPPSTGNYAYLQLLSTPDPSDICSAILFFKTLSTNNTAIQDRLFMYPQEWEDQAHQQSKPVSTALSMLRSASLTYGIWLLPIDMTAATSKGYSSTDTILMRLGQIQFMNYDSVLYLQTPGLVLDTAKLDAVLLDRPLPLRHDKSRPDSYNNEAWIPMPLRADRDATLPPVYLVTVNNIAAGNVEARGHVPNVALPGFGSLVAGPWAAAAADPATQPGYVYFERDDDGHVRWADNPLFGLWRAQQAEVCEGLDLDGAYRDDDDDDDYDL